MNSEPEISTPEYEQVGYIITGQEEQRDEATGYVQKSWPTIEIYRCPVCGALVTDTAFHTRWHGTYCDYVGPEADMNPDLSSRTDAPEET